VGADPARPFLIHPADSLTLFFFYLFPPLLTTPYNKQRHDLLSAGVGALFVTTYCVGKGQDPATGVCVAVCVCV